MTSIHSDPNQLYERLQHQGLDHHFARFVASGITHLQSLSQVSLNDYEEYGVSKPEERKKLFLLIQCIKTELSLQNKNACLPSHTTTPLNSRNGRVMTKRNLSISKVASPSENSKKNINNNSSSGSGSGNGSQHMKSRPSTSSMMKNSPLAFKKPLSPKVFPTPISPESRLKPPSTMSSNIKRLSLRSTHSISPFSMTSSQSKSSAIQSPASSKSSVFQSPTHSKSSVLQSPAKSVATTLKSKRYSIAKQALIDPVNKNPPTLHPHISVSKPRASISVKHQQTHLGLDSYGISEKMTHCQKPTHASKHHSSFGDKITVCVRKRPLSSKELHKNDSDIIEVASHQSLVLCETKFKLDRTKYVEEYEFVFDEVFDEFANNEFIYQKRVKPLVGNIFSNGKATCFVYGQTGSGKTYTMLHSQHGLYILATKDILELLSRPQYSSLTAWVGFYEIYQGQLYDLFNSKKKIYARENKKQNVCIVGLCEFPISNLQDFQRQVDLGLQSRSTGVTGANLDSSRSHAVLQICLKNANRKAVGKISFIDLAGSERGADREEVDKVTKLEGSEINKSLLALKECIRAMDQEALHLPFRQSKLTQVLKDSFIGNSKTCMIATIAPNQSSSEHTLNTLRYAYRVKELKRGPDGKENLKDCTESGTLEESPDASPTSTQSSVQIYDYDSEFIESESLPGGDFEHCYPNDEEETLLPRTESFILSPKKNVHLPPIPGTPGKLQSKKESNKMDHWKEKLNQSVRQLQTSYQKSRSEDHLELLNDELLDIIHKFEIVLSSES